MKLRLLFCAILLSLAMTVVAQAATDTVPNSQNRPVMAYYIEVVSVKAGISKNSEVTINAGNVLLSRLGLREEDAKKVLQQRRFAEPLDAINYLASKGWRLVDTYTTSVATTTVTRFILTAESSDPKVLMHQLMGVKQSD